MTDELSHSVSAPPLPEASARGHLASHLRLWLVAVVGLGVDLWTKHLAFSKLPSDPFQGKVVIPRLMSFHRSLNSGALFGLGKGYTFVFIIASILALGFVLFLFVHSSRRRWSLHIALGLVLAGALGNLYDRTFSIADVVRYSANGREYAEVGKIIEQADKSRMMLLGSWPEGAHPRPILQEWKPSVKQMGVVRDFIRMEPRIRIGSREFDIWPWVFNVADALLVFGVALLMLNFWRERKPDHQTPPTPTQTNVPV